jgi:hypothetical protein
LSTLSRNGTEHPERLMAEVKQILLREPTLNCSHCKGRQDPDTPGEREVGPGYMLKKIGIAHDGRGQLMRSVEDLTPPACGYQEVDAVISRQLLRLREYVMVG